MSELSRVDSVRPLTLRERASVVALLQRGSSSDPDGSVSAVDRARWLDQVPATFAGRACACGACPSIELTDADGRTPVSGDGRVVLEAATDEALLMLFVDEDRLSYLELAPLDEDGAFAEFPETDRWL